MKTKLLLSLLTVLLSTGIALSGSGDTIFIAYGTPADVDGVISPGEWDDASYVELTSISGRVYIKYTDTHFFVAFTDSYGYYMSTGIYFDMLNFGGPAPQVHDIWLHGSAAAFEFYGTGSSWQMVTPSGWDYVSNTANEFSIPFSKLGLVPGSTINMGILFSFLDWSTTHNEITWPVGGFPNCSNPESWGTGIMQITTAVEEFTNIEINIIPNPATSYISIETNEIIHKINIIDSSGRTIATINSPEKIIALHNLSEGIYFMRFITEKGTFVRKFLKKS